MNKQNKGITLIALIITIIILLILAGVTINVLIGDNGLFKIAKNAVTDYKTAEQNERNLLGEYVNLIDNYTGEGYKKISAEIISFTSKDSTWNVENVKEALDYLYNN